jgi:thiol-disulfide isomerase/thioredoxin
MKRAITSTILLISLFTSFFASAQKIVNQPGFAATNAPKLGIEKVELSDTATVIFFNYTAPGNQWFRMSAQSYITAGSTKLVARSVSGIQFDKESYTTNGQSLFSMVFPPVAAKTTTIDFYEGDCDNCFRVVDIALNTPAKNNLLPQAMHTAWFKTNGSKAWVLSVNDRKIIYDSRAWDYKIITATQGTYKINLKNGKTIKSIYLKNTNNQLTAWEDGKPKQILTNEPDDQKFAVANDSPFSMPLLKNDSATLTGFINGYSPKLGFKTGLIYVNDIISGKQNSYSLNIAGDGSFKAKLPMAYPEGVFLTIGNTFKSVFTAPGKKLFVYLDLLNDNNYQFMGDYATVNYELTATAPILEEYNQVMDKAAELTPLQYQQYITAVEDRNLKKIDDYRASNGLSLKGYQALTNQIKYRAAVFLIEYNMLREEAYAKANKDKDPKSIAQYKPIKLDDAYLNVFATYPLNDELSVLSESYDTFINRLKFINEVRFYLDGKQIQYMLNAYKAVPPVNEGDKKLQADLNAALISGEVFMYDIYKRNTKAFETVNEQMNDYYKAHPRQIESQADAVKALIKSDIGFTHDIIEVQEKLGIINSQLKPKDKKELAEIKTKMSNPNVYNALAHQNQNLADKIEANSKIKTGFVLNKMPKTTADSVFNAILSKYKGKAVYVDFWATWCAPCRAGIEEIAPLKDEMKKDNVAFVYITDPSSPEDTYKKMVPGIPGEHYKLNKDEWNYIAGKFSITGIPRYMLVDKNGMIVNDRYHGASNGIIKADLLKIAAE